MTAPNPATKILNRAYCRHLIKIAQGHQSRPGANNAARSPSPKPATSSAQPSIAGAAAGGAWQGVKNIAGGAGNAAIGIKDVVGGVSEAVAGAGLRAAGDSAMSWWLGDKSIEQLNPQWANQAPQQENAAQVHDQRRQQYFSHPWDRDLDRWYSGANNAANRAAKMVPSVLSGQAVLGAAGKVPVLARAGNAINQAFTANKNVDRLGRGATAVTGLPLHPSALGLQRGAAASATGWRSWLPRNWTLPGVTGVSQSAQHGYAAANPETGNLLPAVVADNTLRNNFGENAPEILDAITIPAAAKPISVMQATSDISQPGVNAQQQQAAMYAEFVPKIEQLRAENASPDQINAAFDDFLKNVSAHTTPEEQANIERQLERSRQQLLEMPPTQKQIAVAGINDPSSPEGQQLIGQGLNNFAESNAAEAPQDPQDWGSWMNDITTKFQAMDPMMQIGMGLGVGAGLLGLLSGLGGGGIGSFLLGALGLGAAGMMGAGAGMFGQDAQNFADDMKYNVGSMLGMIPEVKKDELAPLLSQDPLAAISKQAPQIDRWAAGLDPEAYAKTIAPQLQQAEARLGELEQLAGQTPYMLTKMTPGLSLAEAQTAITNARAVLADAKNPNGQLGSQLALAREFRANPVAVRNRELGNTISNWLKGGEDMNIAQHILMEQLITKAARCWAGYEPVPGKKPYSNDSCRPVGGKKKKRNPPQNNL